MNEQRKQAGPGSLAGGGLASRISALVATLEACGPDSVEASTRLASDLVVLLYRTGQRDPALTLMAAAVGAARRHAPGSAVLRDLLDQHGNLLAEARSAGDAVAILQEALELTGEHPERPGDARRAAGLLLGLSNALLQLERFAEAEQACVRGKALLASAPRSIEHVLQDRSVRASLANNHGVALRMAGRLDEAIVELEAARAFFARLATGQGSRSTKNLARTLKSIAVTRRAMGMSADAMGALDESSRHFQALMDAGERIHVLELSGAWSLMAEIHAEASRHEVAIELRQRAVTLLRHEVASAGGTWLEGFLAADWISLSKALLRAGHWGLAEDELFRCADMLPHRVEVAEGGQALYLEMMSDAPRLPAPVMLPPEEVREGWADFAALVLPFHDGSWRGTVLQARHFVVSGQRERGVSLLAQAAQVHGATEPRLVLKLAELLGECERHDEARAAAERAVTLLRRQLLPDATRHRQPAEIPELASGLVAAVSLAAATSQGGDSGGHSLDRLLGLRDALSVLDLHDAVLGDRLRRDRQAFADQLTAGIRLTAVSSERLQRFYEHGLAAIFAERWEEVRAATRGLLDDVVAGRLDEEEACAAMASGVLALRDTREGASVAERARMRLRSMLPPAAWPKCPELLHLESALVAREVIPPPGNWRLVIVSAGTAVEGALVRHLFGRFVRAVREGALPTPSGTGPFALQFGTRPPPLTLGALCEPWGRLVSGSTEESTAASIARWVADHFLAAVHLQDRRLNVLDRVTRLRNGAAHARDEDPTAADATEMLELADVLLRGLYRARFGEPPAVG